MEKEKHKASYSTVRAAQNGKKISRGLVRFHLKGGQPERGSIAMARAERERAAKKEKKE